MIDLTPLDVRKKRGDFAKALRGYDAEEVDSFLELVAERFEELVKENLRLSERTERLAEQVTLQEGREKAVQEALVTAQALREDVKQQSLREADLSQRETQALIDQMLAEAEGLVEGRKQSLADLERQRLRFLKSFRTLLERELDGVEVEESRTPLQDVAHDIELGGTEVDEPREAEDGLSGDVAELGVEPEDDAIAAMVEVEEADEAEEVIAEEVVSEEVVAEEVVSAAVDDEETVVEKEVVSEEVAADDGSPDPTAGDDLELIDYTDATGDIEEPVTVEVEESVAVEVEGDEPNDAEPTSEDEESEAAGDDDGSLWLNSLTDSEPRDEGRWS